MQEGNAEHPDAEDLAAFIDGNVDEGLRERLTGHIVACPECRQIVAETIADIREEDRPRSHRLGVVSYVALLIVGVAMLWSVVRFLLWMTR